MVANAMTMPQSPWDIVVAVTPHTMVGNVIRCKICVTRIHVGDMVAPIICAHRLARITLVHAPSEKRPSKEMVPRPVGRVTMVRCQTAMVRRASTAHVAKRGSEERVCCVLMARAQHQTQLVGQAQLLEQHVWPVHQGRPLLFLELEYAASVLTGTSHCL